MQYRPMQITVISAKGLKRVKHLSKMDVYVLVALTGGPEMEQKTPVDMGSGPNPNWNFPMNFNVDEDEAMRGHLSLSFKVMCHRRIHSDKDIGAVSVPVKELLENGRDGKFVKYVSYQLKKPNGKHRGELNLSYKFANHILESSSSVTLGEQRVAAAYPPAGYPMATNEQCSPMGQPGLHMVQHHLMGCIHVQGTGVGLGYGLCPPPPPANGQVEAAFLSGVFGGLLIGEMLGNAPSPSSAFAGGGESYDYEAGDCSASTSGGL